ncbi:AMP deaminase [Trifolium repens]|nr:AMP deaminase [Trifolium repens]
MFMFLFLFVCFGYNVLLIIIRFVYLVNLHLSHTLWLSHWLGKEYYKREVNGNDIHKTNVPRIRVEFRDTNNKFNRLKLSFVHPLNIDDGLAHILRLKILIIYIPRDHSASAKLVELHIIMFLLETGKCLLILIWLSVKMIRLAIIGWVHRATDTCCT